MNVNDAIYATVHDYQGGAPALAARLQMRTQVLINKTNPNNDTHFMRVDEAGKIMTFTGDLRILDALAQEQGCTVVAMPPVADVGNDELMFKQQELVEELCRLASKLRSSIQDDGHIDRGERADLYEEARTIYQKAHELVAVAVLVYGEK